MKKVLFIANQFPPMGGSGVQRSTKFVKYLWDFNYESIVFTRTIDNMSLKDETLLNDIPNETKIIRTKASECSEWQGVFRIPGKVLAKLSVPDSAAVWAKKSRKRALQAIQDNKIGIIYSTSAPYSDHLLALYLKKKMPNLKWVADFRDEWTNNPYTLDNPYNPIRTAIEKKMEKAVLENADRIIANTPVMMKNFIQNNNMSDEKFVVITNGYDKEDFKGITEVKPQNDKMTMVYTGLLYGRRRPDTFFKALEELKAEGKIDGDKFKVKLIGNYHVDKLSAKIASYGLTDQIEIVGYVPHNVCIRHQLSADALVLIEGTGRGADAFYTGKIFEYMNTGRPVLAILPEGVATDLVNESKIGIVAHTDDVAQIKVNILNYYEKWCNGNLEFAPDRQVIERFERKELTRQLAELFDRL